MSPAAAHLGVHIAFFCLSFGALAEEELEPWLARRLSDRLDLRTADAAELSRLPWLDAVTAEAIVGLREAGALRDWESLSQVPGLDAATLAAIQPFVELNAPGRSLEVEASLRARSGEGTTSTSPRVGLQGQSGPLRARLRSDAQSARGALECESGSARLLVGHLRARFGLQLLPTAFESDSHMQALAAARQPTLSASTALSATRAEMGLGFELTRRAIVVLQADESLAGVAMGSDTRLRFGGRVRQDASLLMLGVGRRQLDLEWALGAAKATILVGRLRQETSLGELGIDFSQAGQAIANTLDPLSGRRLDRARSGFQLRHAWRTRTFTGALHWRRLHSGAGDARETETRLLGESTHRLGLRTLGLRASVERQGSDPLRVALQLRLTQRLLSGVRQSLEFRHEPEPGADRRLFATRWEGGMNWNWQVALAYSDGARSVFDARGLPGAGSLLRWLPPQAVGLTVGLASRGLGLWLDSVRSQEGSVEIRAGTQWSGRFGSS